MAVEKKVAVEKHRISILAFRCLRNWWTSLKVKQSQKIFKLETQVDDLASQLASPKNLVRKVINENSDSEKEISADAFGEIFGLYQAKQRTRYNLLKGLITWLQKLVRVSQ